MSSESKNAQLVEGSHTTSGDVAVQATGVSKCYQLYDKPHHRLKQAIFPHVQQFLGMPVKTHSREFWALKDVSFEVKKGQTVGIIGRNGSGKSTLLQVIAGTLEPTYGKVEVNGRVAALLELGSGFNPEFTGRENVYINATILGLSRQQIDAKFDEIAAFADIGEFIEQPTKTYSSGMYVRLAFAVQVAVDPDVLIIDEALAVGDMRFTMKCIRKMRQLVDTGTSCILVTHDMSSIVNFCSKALWLHDGVIHQSGDPKSVTMNYSNFMAYGFLPPKERSNREGKTQSAHSSEEEDKTELLERIPWRDLSRMPSSGEGGAKIMQIALCKEGHEETMGYTFGGGERAELFLKITNTQCLRSPIVCADFRDSKGNLIFGLNTYFMNQTVPVLHPGGHMVLKFGFRMPLLMKGDYGISVAVADGDSHVHVQHHIVNEATIFHMIPGDVRQSYYMVVNESCHCQILAMPMPLDITE